MNKKRSLLNIYTDIGGKIINLVLGILIPKLLIDSFGSNINGLISSINNLLVYVNLLEAGIGGASIQALYGVLAENNVKERNSILAATDLFYKRTGVYFLAIVSIIAFLYPFCISSNLDYFFIVSIILISAIPSAIRYLFQGKYTVLLTADNRGYILNLIISVTNILGNILKIVLIMAGFDVIAIQLGAAILYILQFLFIELYVKYRYKDLSLNGKKNIEAISKKNYVLVHNISSTIFSNIDILVLTIFCNLKIVSVYTVYNMVFNQINQVTKSFSNGFNASFGQLFQKDREAFRHQFTFFSILFRSVALILILVTGILILPFMRIYTKSITDVNYVNIFLPVLFFSSNYLDVIRWPEVLAINVSGYFKNTMIQSVLETMINIVLSIFLVNKYGIFGVLIATSIALMYRTTDMIIFVYKKILDESPVKTLGFIYMNFFFSILAIYFLCNLIYCTNYFNLLLMSIFMVLLISIIVYVELFFVYPKCAKIIFETINNYLKYFIKKKI